LECGSSGGSTDAMNYAYIIMADTVNELRRVKDYLHVLAKLSC